MEVTGNQRRIPGSGYDVTNTVRSNQRLANSLSPSPPDSSLRWMGREKRNFCTSFTLTTPKIFHWIYLTHHQWWPSHYTQTAGQPCIIRFIFFFGSHFTPFRVVSVHRPLGNMAQAAMFHLTLCSYPHLFQRFFPFSTMIKENKIKSKALLKYM